MRSYLLILALALLTLACQKEFHLDLENEQQLTEDEQDIMAASDQFVAHPVGETMYSFKKEPRKVRIFVADSVKCVGFGGGACIIRPRIFMKKDSTLVDGWVDLYFTDILSFPDMIYNGVTTLGANGILETAGIVDIVAVQNTDTLLLKPGATIDITIPAPFLPGYSVFTGIVHPRPENSITWEPGAGLAGPDAQGILVTGVDTLTWTHIGRSVQPGTTGTYYVSLPAGFNAANTMTYMMFGPVKSLFNLVQDGNGLFSSTGLPGLPVGRNTKIVAVAKQNNKYYYSENSILVAAGDTLKVTEMLELSVNALKAKLDAL